MALFRLFVISRDVSRYFVFSRGVMLGRYFVVSPRHNAKRNDEKTKKTPCEKTK